MAERMSITIETQDKITGPVSEAYQRILRLEAEGKRLKVYSERAQRIADRLIPVGPRAHGFYQPEAFYDRGVAKFWNRRLALYLGAKLRARGEGGLPRIGVPKNSEHIFGPGNGLYDVSKFIEAQNEAAQ